MTRLPLVALAFACTVACASHTAPARTPASPPAAGTVIGEFRENHYGVWRPWQPVLVGAPVRFTPATGWRSEQEAVAALASLAERSPGRPSSVALFAVGDRFVARYVVDRAGNDLRPWHIPLETRAGTARWVTTVDGPAMTVTVTAQARSLDWCGPYIQGTWAAVPASSDAFAPTSDPALLDHLYRRRTRFAGTRIAEWTSSTDPAQTGAATFDTAGSTCRVTVELGGASEVREYVPESDDTMHLVVPGSSSPLLMKRARSTSSATMPP